MPSLIHVGGAPLQLSKAWGNNGRAAVRTGWGAGRTCAPRTRPCCTSSLRRSSACSCWTECSIVIQSCAGRRSSWALAGFRKCCGGWTGWRARGGAMMQTCKSRSAALRRSSSRWRSRHPAGGPGLHAESIQPGPLPVLERLPPHRGRSRRNSIRRISSAWSLTRPRSRLLRPTRPGTRPTEGRVPLWPDRRACALGRLMLLDRGRAGGVTTGRHSPYPCETDLLTTRNRAGNIYRRGRLLSLFSGRDVQPGSLQSGAAASVKRYSGQRFYGTPATLALSSEPNGTGQRPGQNHSPGRAFANGSATVSPTSRVHSPNLPR